MKTMKIKSLENCVIEHHDSTRSSCGCDMGRESYILTPYGSRLSDNLEQELQPTYRDYDDGEAYLVNQDEACTVVSWNDPAYCKDHE